MQRFNALLVILTTIVFATGCKEEKGPAAVQGINPTTTSVASYTVKSHSFQRKVEFPATVLARQQVTLMPKVPGDILKIYVAEGDKVAIRVTWRGTHKGEFMGIAPTGNKIEMTNTLIFRIAVGKLAENWATIDELRLMQQLGVIPKQ